MLGHMLVPDIRGLGDVVNAALTNQRLVILLVSLLVVTAPDPPGHRPAAGVLPQPRGHGI